MADDLDALIARAKAMPPITDADLAEQRRSFVRAEVAFGSDADEAAYRAAVEAGDDQAVAKLDAEAAARVSAYEAQRDEG